MKYFDIKPIVFFSILLAALPGYGQGEISLKDAMAKLQDSIIYDTARIGTRQELAVLLEVTAEINALKEKHRKLHVDKKGSSADSFEEMLTPEEEAAWSAEEKDEIDKVKRSLFVENKNSRTKIVRDFSRGPVIIVSIGDSDALLELLRHPRVKSVGLLNGAVPAGTN